MPFPRQLVSEALYGMFLLSRRSGLEIGKAAGRGEKASKELEDVYGAFLVSGFHAFYAWFLGKCRSFVTFRHGLLASTFSWFAWVPYIP